MLIDVMACSTLYLLSMYSQVARRTLSESVSFLNYRHSFQGIDLLEKVCLIQFEILNSR